MSRRSVLLERSEMPLHASLCNELKKLQYQNNQLHREIVLLRQNQPERPLIEGNSRLLEANEKLVLAACGAQDKQANAEASIARQTEFLSMLAHELRNPLQPIAHANALIGSLGAVHVMLPRLHAVISRQVGHLSRLIEDLLDVSRINSGKITLKESCLRIRDVIALAVETSEPHLVEHKQSLQIDDPHGDVFVYGDPLRLAQVLSNLLNNASKFSREGEEILLRTAVDNGWIHISVIDHGAGIAEDLMPHVFNLFTQGAHSLDRSKGGLGIGLTLVRSLVEMHGGTVRGESAGIGKGSQFTVTLPIALASHEDLLPPAALASNQPQRILLVEDNVDANDLLCSFLETKGHIVSSCYDGDTAISMASAGHYDFLLCDIGLPGNDGFSVVKSIKSKRAGNMPICVATSGYNQAEDRALALASGFDHYLVKPIDLNVLQELFEVHGR